MNQSCDLCRHKQEIRIEFTLTYLAFLQIGHVVLGHLLFDQEVLNSKISGIFRSPVILIELITRSLHEIESTSTGTESKFHKYFEHEYYEDEMGGYHFYRHQIPVPKKFLNEMPTGIFWFDSKIWVQYEFEIDWDDREFSTIFPNGLGWNPGARGPTWWRAGRHLTPSDDTDEAMKQLIRLIRGSNNKFLSPNC